MSDACMKADSERQHFMMYWNVERYDDGTRYVFCEELEEYTFYPYAGKLKDVPGYSENKDAFEAVQIFLIFNRAKKLAKVPCSMLEKQKKIYLNDGAFNKHWGQISKNICREIRRKQNSNVVTHASMNNKVDLSLLETPTRSAKISGSFIIEYKGKEIDIEKQRLISKRASALENNRIRFVFAKSDRLVHDKSCQQVAKIEYWDFGASEELPRDRELCPRCKRKIYIRNAIKNDTKRFGWYVQFFQRGKAGTNAMEKFLYNTDMKLHMESLDELTIKCKEDTWKVRIDSQGTCSLYHNNYVMVSDAERYITTGFHRQKYHPPYLSGVLSYIEGYDWEKHLPAKTNEPVAEKNVANEEEIIKKESSIWQRVIHWVKGILVKKIRKRLYTR